MILFTNASIRSQFRVVALLFLSLFSSHFPTNRNYVMTNYCNYEANAAAFRKTSQKLKDKNYAEEDQNEKTKNYFEYTPKLQIHFICSVAHYWYDTTKRVG